MNENKLQKAVADWLREQGYPLEMRTARVFKRRNWFQHQGRRYVDPTTNKEREIDFLAFFDDPEKVRPIHGRLVIECKWTPKKPWILFSSEQQSLTPVGHLMSTPMTDTAIGRLRSLAANDVSKLPLFSSIREGYALVQAFNRESATDAAYAAVHGAVSAAEFFAREMSAANGRDHLFIPTVVLDGEFFRCGLAPDGEVLLHPTEMETLFYMPAANGRRDSACVHIVKESALDKFIDLSEATFTALRALLRTKSS
jgi:hypothetical protein